MRFNELITLFGEKMLLALKKKLHQSLVELILHMDPIKFVRFHYIEWQNLFECEFNNKNADDNDALDIW